MRDFLKAMASLRLTVVLLSLSMALIFIGTLAQVRVGVWEAVDTIFRSPIAWIDVQWLVPESMATTPWQFPLPGGATIGVLLLVNLLAAHNMRFSLTWKRLGIILIHAGLIVLLVGEFVTAIWADEGLMTIREGETARFAEDLREVELAVIEPGAGDRDWVISVPGSRIVEAAERGGRIVDEKLPVEIEVLRWIPNARLLQSPDGGEAEWGVGREARAEALPPVRGVDGAATDAPAALVRLTHQGEALGTWLLWVNLVEAQRVPLPDGSHVGIALRYRRTYTPCSLTLLEFRHDRFVGTEIPRNFSSRLRLRDDSESVDREVTVWMNHPLRYRGLTFYQASYLQDGSGTVLQVVRNPGAWIPYAACVLVGVGLLWHFGLSLQTFLNRSARRPVGSLDSPHSGRWVPWFVGSIGVVVVLAPGLRTQDSGPMDFDRFATLPVTSGGRIKPLDSAARHVLMVAGGRQSVKHDSGEMSAVEFLGNLMADPEAISALPVVRIDHPDVLALMGLEPTAGGRLSLNAIEPHWPEIAAQAEAALDVDSKRRDDFQRAVVQAYSAVQTVLSHARMREPYAIPPLGPDQEWRSFDEAFLDGGAAMPPGHPALGEDVEAMHPAVSFWIAMMTAWAESDADSFNRAVSGYDALLRRDMGPTMARMDLEVYFNRARLFAAAMALYLPALLLLGVSMLCRPVAAGSGASMSDRLRGGAVGLLWAGLIVHTAAMALRMYLTGRPPVTNLYSSAVFVGWASVGVGLVIERLIPLGLSGLGAAAVGFASLVVAHNLGSEGDTMQMMQAVLDSNFWLATHVVTITLGYSATLLAGAMGVVFVLTGVLTRRLTPARAAALHRMTYGVVCFALLLSFVGTVLGGIWADQSWGRFWGWDPKENGAALVVLNAAIILHARFGGMIRRRGLIVLAVAGNIVTAWSWFGTNMLGVGLHAYGFMDSAVFWLLAFIVSQCLVISLGLLPTAMWRSCSIEERA